MPKKKNKHDLMSVGKFTAVKKTDYDDNIQKKMNVGWVEEGGGGAQ